MSRLVSVLVMVGLFAGALGGCGDSFDGPSEPWRVEETGDDGREGDIAEPRRVSSARLIHVVGAVADDRFLAVDLRGPDECVMIHLQRFVGTSTDQADGSVAVNDGWSLVSIHLVGSPCVNVEYDGDSGAEALSAEGQVVFENERPYVDSVDLRLRFPGGEAGTERRLRIVLDEDDVSVT